MSTWPKTYFDCSISSRSRTSRYFTPARPLEVEHAVDALQHHRDPLEAVGQLRGNRRQLDAAGLLEVGELRDLHAVEQHLPADAPGAERRRLPVVFFEADVVLARVDAARLEALEIELLHIVGRRLEDHLKLVVLERRGSGSRRSARRPGGATAARSATFQCAGPSTRRNVSGCIVPAPTSISSGCWSAQPRDAQNSDSLKMRP